MEAMDAPVEPPACDVAFCAESDGRHYSWRGQGREKATTIGVYNVQTERWTLTHTSGSPSPGLFDGGCAIIANYLYCFGGWDESSRFNDLYKLQLESFQWNKVNPRNNSSDQPTCKASCGFVAVNERTLACFGGYSSEPTHIQPGSTFTKDVGSNGWTNEFHFFDIQEDVWSSPQMKGERPPPCSDFTFTKVDQDRAVLFGGRQSGYNSVNDLYLFNLRKMIVTKVEPTRGEQWPEGRDNHAACCLNFGGAHPMVLVYGGLGTDYGVRGDMWILNVDSGKWTEVTTLESVKKRLLHSITATVLGPGLTEVLVFGGKLKWSGDPIAETTIMRFERLLSRPTIEKWALVDVAHNNTRGSSQRLREKREKIRQATHRSSSEIKDSSVRGVSIPVLPRNWTVVSSDEVNKLVYQHRNNTRLTSTTPPGYPLIQTSTHPRVTFYDAPQERQFPSTGSHADFRNGVEVTVPPQAISPESTIGVKVQPGFAPSDVFVMPEGIQSASPSYLISSDCSAGLNGEITVTMEHHVRESTREEADDLLFLQADPIPVKGSVYRYRNMSEGRSEFTPGENKGRLSTRHLSERFLKIGYCQKCGGRRQSLEKSSKTRSRFKKWFGRSKSSASSCPYGPPPNGSEAPGRNLYTVRVYRSPPQTTGDRLCVVVVSLFHRLFFEFLRKFDSDILPYEYPALSRDRADITTKEPLCLVELEATLAVTCGPSWRSVVDQQIIFKDSVDLPVTGNFMPEELHSYPPKMVCRFYPEERAESTTCTLALHGFDKPVSINVALLISRSHMLVTVDTIKLQLAVEVLKNTASLVNVSQLRETVGRVVFLSEMLTSALKSSSLGELAVHTDSIKTEVGSILTTTRKVTEECTRPTIRESIAASFSKIEVLSHQLCHVAKVKLKHCQDQSEESAALIDLVESGAGLLRTVDCLLKDMQTLSDISAHKNWSYKGQRLIEIENCGMTADQLDCEIEEQDITYLAEHFDNVELYLRVFGLTTAEQVNVRRMVHVHDNQIAMAECLSLWRRHNPSRATLRTLLEILQSLRKEEIASKVCDYYHPKHKL